jgi:hypothetical protein
MESTVPNNVLSQYTKMMGLFKLPTSIDVPAILESRRKDIEALASVNLTALAGIQSISQKQAELLCAATIGVQSLVMKLGASQGKTYADQGEPAARPVQKALASVRDIADTAYKVQSDSFAVVSKRVAENVEEVKGLLRPKK